MGAMPSWSPDGNRIVFSNYSPRGVWIMNADGTGRELLDADGWGGEWCPKGEMIAYSVSANGANIAVRDLATSASVTLLDDRYTTIFWGMGWSPDGQWIAFKAPTRDGTTELALVHVEGHKQGFRVLLPTAIPDMTDLLHNPSWSPDGTQIIAAVITKANPARQLYVLDAAGKEPAKLLPGLEKGRWYNDMAWSPDGKRIVVSTRPTAIGPAVQWLTAPLEQRSSPGQPIHMPILPAGVPAQPMVAPAADLLPSDARELVDRYVEATAAIQQAAAAQVRQWRQKWSEELKPLQDKYTREGKLDEAVAIRDLIRTLKEPGDQAAVGGEQDPVVAGLRRVGAKLVAKGARGSWSPDSKRIAVGKMPFGSGISVVEVTGVASGAPRLGFRVSSCSIRRSALLRICCPTARIPLGRPTAGGLPSRER